MKLSLKIVLGISTLLILIFGLMGLLIFSSEKVMLIERDFMDRIIVAPFHDMMISRDTARMREFYKDIQRLGSIESVRIFRSKSVVRQFGHSETTGRESALVKASLETGRDYHKIIKENGKYYIYSTRVLTAKQECLKCHIAAGDEALGVFAAKYSLGAMGDVLKKRHIGLFTMTFMAIFLVIGCLYVLIKYMVLDKLKVLVSATEAVGRGDLNTVVSLSTGDEMQKLGDSFNEMTTRLKDIQEGMIHAEKLAAIGRLAAGITHEVNNPTGIIISRIECIEDDLKSAEKIDVAQLLKDLDVIKKHAIRIASITQGLLTFSRKSGSERGMVDMNSLIDKTHALLENELSAKKITFRKSPDRPFYAWGNENELQQVLFNILDNARDSMRDGGALRVRLSETGGSDSGGERKYIKVEMSDSGEGIAAENINRIFEPYFSTKETGKGTGLGLAICYRIVADHGGRIDVKSEVGGGTTFTILLPVSRRAN